MFSTFYYAQCNDSFWGSHQQLDLLFAKNVPAIYACSNNTNYDSTNTCCTYGQLYEWRGHFHISRPTILLFFKKSDWSRMPTGDKYNMKYLVCIFPYYPGEVPFPFMSKNLPEGHICNTWINEETTVNSPKDSLISTLPSIANCEMTKCTVV